MSPRRFRVGHASTAPAARTRPKRQAATGTLFRWRLSEPATVRIAIFRRVAGHLVGRRCQLTGRATRAKAKRCVFDRRLGTISRRAGGGAGRLAFSRRLGKTPLAPGGYGARIAAATADGRRSRSINLRFQVMLR